MKRSGIKIMFKLIGLVKPLTSYMILAILMGVIGHLFASFITILGGIALLDILGHTIFLKASTAITLIIIFAIFRGILRYAEQTCNHFIAFKLLALIRDNIFSALRKLCPAKLEGKDRGNLISVITSDIELLEVFYAHTISPVAIAILFSIVLSIFIGYFHYLLGLIALLAYLCVGFIIPLIMNKLGGEAAINFRNSSGDLSSFVLESMRGLDETLQYDNGNSRLQLMNEKTNLLAKLESKMKTNIGINISITNTTILLFDVLILMSSVYLYSNQIINFSGILIPFIALMSSFGPCVALANLGSTLQNTLAAGNRVLDILEEEPLINDIHNKNDIKFNGASAQDVTFAYKDEIILNNFSVELPQNNIIGIIGKSGSGKSTLLKLLMRFWKVPKGKISISNYNIEEINTENLRNIESFVTQETHLFHDSIRNNIKIAKLNATDNEVEEACKKASIHDFITKLPKGYDTPVGELGDTLSGGEKQRIGLARAFLHNAPFMLLDEPTSNLDSLNEAIILKSLHSQKEGKTIVLVSHRPSTMNIVDKCYSVENGRLS
ncbi:MAG: ABC transporter ATP-binding protein [Eubacteriales bacterium]|nr:ABC transporter ATP-binding protein [Eubacteriales bacterium]MDY3333041.1 ABC transporter ATP-binding protein [Gallibacter sp.]